MVTAGNVIGVLTALAIVLFSSDANGTETATATCTAVGKLADPSNCRKYFICTALSGGGFSQTSYNCPGEASFDPASRKCSLLATCDVPFSSSTTTPSATTPATPVTSKLSFVCPTAAGRFADPETCTKYFMCSASVAHNVACPGSSLFDPTSTKCSMIYDCPL